MLLVEDVIEVLDRFTWTSEQHLRMIVVGGLALQLYDKSLARPTIDLDAEIREGNIDLLDQFLTENHIPADLSEDVSHWGMIDIPPGYRGRVKKCVQRKFLEIGVLDYTDFVISKLRVARQVDIDDTMKVIAFTGMSEAEIRDAAEASIAASVKSTELWKFRQTLDIFFARRL